LGGLSVTDNGFGVWNVTFPVTGAVNGTKALKYDKDGVDY
jgi:hypothetical protein